MNPDDVILRKPEPKKTSSFDPSTAFVKEPTGFFEKLLSWWDGLKIKPHVEIHVDKHDPEHRPGALIGIKGTF